MSTAEEYLKNLREQKAAMIEAEAKQHFSYGLEATLTDAERTADGHLKVIREKIANNAELNRTIHDFFENKEVMENCELFKVLNTMPKGALHHIHTTAANPIDTYLKLTYDERVYFNSRENLFKVYPKHEGVLDGYVQCTQLRSFYSSPEDFDTMVMNEILLGPKESANMESHAIWKHFQQKFSKVGEIGKFIPFFKFLTKAALERCIA